MPKKILFESAVHQFASAGNRLQRQLNRVAPAEAERLARWIRDLDIEDNGPGTMRISWSRPAPGERHVEIKGARFYLRGDTAIHAEQQRNNALTAPGDRIMAENQERFDEAFRTTVAAAQVIDSGVLAQACRVEPAPRRPEGRRRHEAEEAFHDAWAASEDALAIDVRRRNEACTAPEMRHIRSVLGDLRGRMLLDVGCGLGEASVYFALAGAQVTALDVSPGMCAATQRLAEANGVKLQTHVAPAEDFALGDRQFDIIYTGNTLHHVDIAQTMDRLLPHLRSDGVFVSWDPVAYNPLINVYRRIATKVRTEDEHPLRLADVRAITGRFGRHDVRWFWCSTLLVFLWMVFIQRRNPNQVRLWKRVIDDADRLAWLYRPLERLDAVLLRWIPFLRPLCWNVVIVGRQPSRS